MKKNLILILALAMLLSLCACGAKAPAEEPAPAAAPEAPAAEPAPEAPAAAPEAPEQPAEKVPTEVEITKDNFEDYFEFVVNADYDNAARDEDGNITALTVYYDYLLRSDYEAAPEQPEENPLGVDFDVSYTSVLNPRNTDFEKLICTEGDDITVQEFSTSITADWWNPDGTICENPAETPDATFKLTVAEFEFNPDNVSALNSLDITNVYGKLVILK